MQQTQGAATVIREQLQTLGGYSGGRHDWLRVVVNVPHAQCYYQFRLARSITPNQTALSRSTSLPTVVTAGLFFGRVFTRSHEFLLRKSPACCAAHNRCNIHSTLPVPTTSKLLYQHVALHHQDSAFDALSCTEFARSSYTIEQLASQSINILGACHCNWRDLHDIGRTVG
jgi:hypothetical protein